MIGRLIVQSMAVLYQIVASSKMADELDRSFLEELDGEMLLKIGDCEYKRSLFLLPTLNKFRREGRSGFCDVVLETEGRHFSVHRCVLAANSRFFYTMFNSGMRESTETVLKLPSVSCIALENILDFFYTQKIILTEDIIEDVLEASSFLLLESLKKTCFDVLKSKLSIHNCFSTRRLALEYNANELLDKTVKFIKDNFLIIVQKSEEFLRISCEELRELLKCREVRVKMEEQVFLAVLKWVKHKPYTRTIHLELLLKVVNISNLQKEFLSEQLRNEPLLQHCIKTLEHYLKPNNNCDKRISQTSYDRLSTKIHNVLVGVGTGKCYRVFCYDVEDNETFILPNLPKCQAFPHLVCLDKTLYIIGGESQRNINFDPVNSVRTFSLENVKSNCGLLSGWTRKPSFREVRRDTSVAVLGRKIYVLGGWMSGASGRVECYDSKTKVWSCVASLNLSRSQLTAVATHSHLLAIGGSCDQVVSSREAEQFDPDDNKWTFLPPMNARRMLASAVFAHGSVYVIGGHDNAFDRITNCEVFNPANSTWMTIAPLPDTLFTNQSVVSLNNEIIAVTGSPESSCNAAWYNRDANVWEKTQNFSLHFNISSYRLCCLQMKKFFLQELPQVTTDSAQSNVNVFNQQDSFVEEDDALLATDLGLSLSEEEDNSSDSEDYYF